MWVHKIKHSQSAPSTSDPKECLRSLEAAIESKDHEKLNAALKQEYVRSIHKRMILTDPGEEYVIEYADVLEFMATRIETFKHLLKLVLKQKNEKCAQVFLDRMKQTQLRVLTSEWDTASIQNAISTMHKDGALLSKSQSKEIKQEGDAIVQAAEAINKRFQIITSQQEDKEASSPRQQLVSAKRKIEFLSTLKDQNEVLSKYRKNGPWIANILVCVCTLIVPYLLAWCIKDAVLGRSTNALFSLSAQGEDKIAKINNTLDNRKPKESGEHCPVSQLLNLHW